MYTRLTLVFLACFLSFLCQAQQTTITIPKTSSNAVRDQYQLGLLELALGKANFSYRIQFEENLLSQARIVSSLKNPEEGIDLYWMGTSPKLEKELRAVHFPIYQGLLGYRVFIIHKNQQIEFNKIQSLADLQRKTGIQGVGWADISILEAAGLKQQTSQYNSILQMINSGHRHYYFSRGIHEAFAEVDAAKNDYPNLVVDDNVLLIYPLAMFFFTNKKNETLANAIENGLKAAHKDGSFHRYFEQEPSTKRALEKANIKNRRWIRIDNPYLTPETQAINSQYWHKLTR